jgi:hypothetical protein
VILLAVSVSHCECDLYCGRRLLLLLGCCWVTESCCCVVVLCCTVCCATLCCAVWCWLVGVGLLYCNRTIVPVGWRSKTVGCW